MQIQLFKLDANTCHELKRQPPEFERDLQKLVETNLKTLLGVDYIASEYSTSGSHGRLDTLGIDQNFAPVIIEYKRGEDRSIINQGLYYLTWLLSHRTEFLLQVERTFGTAYASRIDWTGARLVLIADDFSKFDIEAVEHIDANIDLIRYDCFESGVIALAKVASKRKSNYLSSTRTNQAKREPMPIQMSLARAPEEKRKLFADFISGLEEIGNDLLIANKGSYLEFGAPQALGRISMTTTQYPKLLLELYCFPNELSPHPLRLTTTKHGCHCRLTDESACLAALEIVRELYSRSQWHSAN